MDEANPSLSITGLVLSLLNYSRQLFGSLQQKALLLRGSDLSNNILEIFWRAVSWANAFFNFIPLETSTYTLFSDKLLAGNSTWTYATIVHSKYLPFASYTLMGCSIVYMFLVLRSVSVSYPDIVEDTDWKTIDNCGTYDFPHSSGASKQHQLDSRFGGPVRDDLRNFMTVRVKCLDDYVHRLFTFFHGIVASCGIVDTQ